MFLSTGSGAEVFMSEHIEARVPVADIVGKCRVLIQGPGAARPGTPTALGVGGSEEVFTCMYHYNHESISLTPLPAQ